MAASKTELLVFFSFLALMLTIITAEPPPLRNDGSSALDVSDSSSLAAEIEQLKLKVLTLDVDFRTLIELIMSYVSEQKISHSITSQFHKGSLDDKELLGSKLHLQAVELEKQATRLRKELEMQDGKKDGLEAQGEFTEKKIHELNLKLEDVKERWLPYWLSVKLSQFQLYIVTYWNESGRPAVQIAIEKALLKKAQVKDWVELHIEMFEKGEFREKDGIPLLKNQWFACCTYLGKGVQLLIVKAVDIYCAYKSFMEPLAFKILNFAYPYIQEARKLSEPYILQIATVITPHLDQVHAAFKLYSEKVFHAYGSFITSSTLYHHQVQQMLKNNGLTRPVATIDLAWFAATALLALPVVFLFKLYSASFSKTSKKRIRSYRRKSHKL
ncbi:hypothetical protein FEM48_Zijuj01G0017300 [Ziziphus jujuba var. spinosa]|uniref:Uncharacterized protein n=1 Tax=Ziziphus jujuba var. spinosa TaxID=714518 RepID=A0A978VYE6_ZIZJJ|nr:hypothetical protein FEM48_Zijuj01G0017300 [Ziziphus jujuba var. spinosa]